MRLIIMAGVIWCAIVASHEGQVPPRHAVPRTSGVITERSGHFAMLEEQALFDDALRRFLQSTAARRAQRVR